MHEDNRKADIPQDQQRQPQTQPLPSFQDSSSRQDSSTRKKQSLNPLWLMFVLGLCCAPWLVRLHHGITAQQQQSQMAARATAFFTGINHYPKNKSAERFDQLGAALGFFPNDARSLTATTPVTKVDRKARARYSAIQPSLSYFLTEQLGNTESNTVANTEGRPIEQPKPPLPAHLKSYLVSVQSELKALQTHLLEQEPPQWAINTDHMSDENYPFAGLSNVLNTQKLLLLSAIFYSEQEDQQTEMLSALEASWQLNQAIAQRPDLVGQIATSITADYQAKLLRQTQNLSLQQLSQWQQRLSQQANQQSVLDGLRFDVWLQYQTLQKSLAKVTRQSSLLAAFSPVHRFALSNIDTAQTAHRTIDLISGVSVCASSQSEIEAQVSTLQTSHQIDRSIGQLDDQWNEPLTPSSVALAQRWKTAGDRALSLELTQQVLSAKQHYQEHRQWPVPSPQSAQIRSSTCPNAYWLHERTGNNALTIRLSTMPTPKPSPALQILLTASDVDKN